MKQKTHSGAKKRFRVTRTGKVMGVKRNKRHLLEKKSARRKRRLTGTFELDTAPARRARKLLNK